MRQNTVGVVALGSLLLWGCGVEGLGSDWKQVEPRVEAPTFTLPQLDGTPVNLSDYRGRVVIMEFWATWCGPCRYSTPSVEAIYRRNRDRGMTVLLVNEGEAAEPVRVWAGQRFTAPILLDRDGRVGARYGVAAIPTLFIIDQEGRLMYRHGGYGGGLERSLQRILDELLAVAPAAAHG